MAVPGTPGPDSLDVRLLMRYFTMRARWPESDRRGGYSPMVRREYPSGETQVEFQRRKDILIGRLERE